MTASLSLRLPDQLKAEAQQYADALGISFNALCSVALKDYIMARQGVALPAGGPSVLRLSGSQAEDAMRNVVSKRQQTAGQSDTTAPVARASGVGSGVPKVGRNEPCPCGSGRKFKLCCGRPGQG